MHWTKSVFRLDLVTSTDFFKRGLIDPLFRLNLFTITQKIYYFPPFPPDFLDFPPGLWHYQRKVEAFGGMHISAFTTMKTEKNTYA